MGRRNEVGKSRVNVGLWIAGAVSQPFRLQFGVNRGKGCGSALRQPPLGAAVYFCSANVSATFSARAAVLACAMFDATATTIPLSRRVVSDITLPPASSPLTLHRSRRQSGRDRTGRWTDCHLPRTARQVAHVHSSSSTAGICGEPPPECCRHVERRAIARQWLPGGADTNRPEDEVVDGREAWKVLFRLSDMIRAPLGRRMGTGCWLRPRDATAAGVTTCAAVPMLNRVSAVTGVCVTTSPVLARAVRLFRQSRCCCERTIRSVNGMGDPVVRFRVEISRSSLLWRQKGSNSNFVHGGSARHPDPRQHTGRRGRSTCHAVVLADVRPSVLSARYGQSGQSEVVASNRADAPGQVCRLGTVPGSCRKECDRKWCR